MEDFTPPAVGTMVTVENTSDNADEIRDFYSAVIGWQVTPMPMGDYDDYVMTTPDGSSWVAGICHRRGPNEDVPSGWIPCFRVADFDEAIARAEANGGKVVGNVRDVSPGSRYAVIEDPNGSRVSIINFPEE